MAFSDSVNIKTIENICVSTGNGKDLISPNKKKQMKPSESFDVRKIFLTIKYSNAIQRSPKIAYGLFHSLDLMKNS